MLVLEEEQGLPAAGAIEWALLDYACSGGAGVDAVVTALVLGTSRASVSAPSNGRTELPCCAA